ncbi:MAG: tRNA guanosine(34) transglycosylase Tgt [Phycisphaerae bacterium]|nr:tRNA guanosine(34) transglycosylase Tgt [Phycisphaerae bacterium]
MTHGFDILVHNPNNGARRGLLATAHGTVDTPAFMPVGTRGSIKGLTPEQVEQTGTQIILGNTYHLLLRPGVEVVERLGGLHALMGWNGPILTDSGGFQVFSLSQLTRIGDDGVEFASHIDGARVVLDAEIATKVQNRLGADIIMCFDECPPYPCESERLERAVERTIRWAKRCQEVHSNSRQKLFAIVQGGVDSDLRRRCAESLVTMDFPGYAIGGLSVGEGHDKMMQTVESTVDYLPKDRPRYLMGVGMPADIVAAVRAGIDMFDCVLPTRNGRNAYAFTTTGPLRLRNAAHGSDSGPLEEGCSCVACRRFSRGAIRHFFQVGEMLGPILLSLHNIAYYQRLMAEIRRRIEDASFTAWAEGQIRLWKSWTISDSNEPETQTPRHE